MARYVIKGYYILLTGDMKIPADHAEGVKYKGVIATFKFLNKID